MRPITPCLWFDTQAEEAAAFYTSIFPDSRITQVTRYGPGAPVPAGTVLSVAFEVQGVPMTAFNGGPAYRFTPAVSLQAFAATQDRLDELWEALLAGGGQPGPCGWLTDRFGLSWQVVPTDLAGLLAGESGRAARVSAALMAMGRIDINALRRAADDR